MRNRITRYEIVLTNGQLTFLVGYTPRLGRPGLMACVRPVGAEIIKATGLSAQAIASWPNTRTLDLGENGWRVKFTGRTQIEAQDTREYPYVAAGKVAIPPAPLVCANCSGPLTRAQIHAAETLCAGCWSQRLSYAPETDDVDSVESAR